MDPDPRHYFVKNLKEKCSYLVYDAERLSGDGQLVPVDRVGHEVVVLCQEKDQAGCVSIGVARSGS